MMPHASRQDRVQGRHLPLRQIQEAAMAQSPALTHFENLQELLEHLGGIAPRRLRLHPPPGTATEKDLLRLLDRTGVICELIDGVLVEKVMGFPEGALAAWIGHLLQLFLDEHDLGMLAGADATARIMPGLV